MKELYILYGVSWHVLKNWLKTISEDLGKRVSGYYNIRQVQLIFETFGIPGQEMTFYGGNF